MALSSLSTVLLPKLSSVDLDCRSYHYDILHNIGSVQFSSVMSDSLFLTKKLISNQTKYGDRLILMKLSGLDHISHHFEIAGLKANERAF